MPTTPNLGLTYDTPLDPATANLWGGTLNTITLAFDGEAATKTIDQDFAGFKLTRPSLIRAQEEVHNAGNISGAVTLDYANGHYQRAVVTGNITSLTVSNWPTGKGAWMYLELAQDATGGRTIALASAYKTAGGAGITLSAAANAVDTMQLVTRDAGTTIRASIQNDWK